MSREPGKDEQELRRLRSEVDDRQRDIRDIGERRDRQDTLIARLRGEAAMRDEHVEMLQERLDATEHQLEDLRAIRDALTPPELPGRPGLELSATFLPAAEQVSGDFYLVAEGPQDSTVLAVGDVVGHGLTAGRRAAFVRTAFAASAAFSDDPCRLLEWANAALIERAGTSQDFVTAACITYLPATRRLRWAYAGHPPALSLDDGQELVAPEQGLPLGLSEDLKVVEGARGSSAGAGMLLYTDGLTEARQHESFFGLNAVSATLRGLRKPSAAEAVAALVARVEEFATDGLTDDLCLLAARIN